MANDARNLLVVYLRYQGDFIAQPQTCLPTLNKLLFSITHLQ